MLTLHPRRYIASWTKYEKVEAINNQGDTKRRGLKWFLCTDLASFWTPVIDLISHEKGTFSVSYKVTTEDIKRRARWRGLHNLKVGCVLPNWEVSAISDVNLMTLLLPRPTHQPAFFLHSSSQNHLDLESCLESWKESQKKQAWQILC